MATAAVINRGTQQQQALYRQLVSEFQDGLPASDKSNISAKKALFSLREVASLIVKNEHHQCEQAQKEADLLHGQLGTRKKKTFRAKR